MFRFRRPTAADAEMLLRWRTEPSITRFMFTDLENPDVDRQRAWLAAIEARRDFRHFIIEHEERPIGYLSYSDIDWVHLRCSSGSYIVEERDRRKLAGFLHNFIMDYCYYGMGMNKIVNYFMEGNDTVIRIQRVLKIREVGVLRQHVHKYGRFHDVYVFETLRSEWEGHIRLFPRETTLAAFAD
ncbi:GNAT family N-acetyltransferase (plasmid) [Azospirillum brasilense]|uniref:GNAT family N-acetyltransferase n=1 Tax=Azospirillum brasilense TaxID=192 RepID=A0A4D8QZG2_AZOBR|nr:GNAT family N-acetyltransferase [Azospirillum brasilense]QCO16645.1 GNAT family N-acetyltransferase [Azospirillum brasilense]